MDHLGCRWIRTVDTTLGYRYLDMDCSEDDFLFDLTRKVFSWGLVGVCDGILSTGVRM